MKHYLSATLLLLLAAATLPGCSSEAPAGPSFMMRDLTPAANPFGPDDPRWQPQPLRTNPGKMAFSVDHRRLFVVLQGSVDRPGREVVAIDVETRRVAARYEVGSGPTGLAVHPGGRHLVVTSRFSNYLCVIDLVSGVISHHEVDFYATEALFDTDGARLYIANRWRDAVQVFDTRVEGGELRVRFEAEVPVGANPEQLLLSPDATRLFVASPTALTISVIDVEALREIDTDNDLQTTDFGAPSGVTRLNLMAPPTSLSIARLGTTQPGQGARLFVTTLSASTHHPPGSDGGTHPYLPPTIGAPNEGFEALQNELAVFDLETLAPVARYTSDSYCCHDFRDVRPDHPDLGPLMPAISTWIVGGALPEASTVVEGPDGAQLLVVYSGSSQLQRFSIDRDGGLHPGPIVSTGFDPRHIAVDPARSLAVVSNRLGESLTFVDLARLEVVDTLPLGADQAAFPATDAEIGELVFFSGASLSVDGDQTCNHCHRDRGNIAKPFSMPMLADTSGSRMTMTTRGLWRTRPWFMEGAMNEDSISAVLGEAAHAANFCCHHFPEVADCAENPPPACHEGTFAGRPLTRDAFFLQNSRALIGQERSFGDAIDVPLDFDGVTRLLGLFLIQEPALLPNPNPSDGPNVERGRLLFNSPGTGCALCHPAPEFAVTERTNPFDLPLLFGPVVTPNRSARGHNLDLVNDGFLARFPGVEQSRSDIALKSSTLLGLWDRAPLFYHDGRARSLREALATPGHPALGPGERGYNEADGVPDSHGGTSHLSPGQLADLIDFILTL